MATKQERVGRKVKLLGAGSEQCLELRGMSPEVLGHNCTGWETLQGNISGEPHLRKRA